MALSCKREAFKLDDGCPSLDVDLTFPDFESCEVAEPSRLKGVAKLDLQKSPAFPVIVPANDPIPVPHIPDIVVDSACPFQYTAYTRTSGSVEFSKNLETKPAIETYVEGDENNCSVGGFRVVLKLPDLSAKIGVGTIDGHDIIDVNTGEKSTDAWSIAVPAMGGKIGFNYV